MARRSKTLPLTLLVGLEDFAVAAAWATAAVPVAVYWVWAATLPARARRLRSLACILEVCLSLFVREGESLARVGQVGRSVDRSRGTEEEGDPVVFIYLAAAAGPDWPAIKPVSLVRRVRPVGPSVASDRRPREKLVTSGLSACTARSQRGSLLGMIGPGSKLPWINAGRTVMGCQQ